MTERNPIPMFLAFACDTYYPTGAPGDFVGAFATLEEAKQAALAKRLECADVYDVAAQEWRSVDEPARETPRLPLAHRPH